MNILFPFVGDTYGGSHISALTLIESLKKINGYKITIGLHEKGLFSSILDERGIDWVVLPRIDYVNAGGILYQFFQMLKCAKSLTNWIAQNNINVVHTNDARMHLSWLLATRLSKASHVWHQRSVVNSRRISLYMLVSDAVVTISNFCFKSIYIYSKKHFSIIDNPIAPLPFDHIYKGKNLFNDDVNNIRSTPVVLFVGNWIQLKRPLIFVRAAKYVLDINPDACIFVMVGEERHPMDDSVKGLINEFGLESKFILAGVVGNIRNWLNASDILVAPAVNEGLGRTLIEASMMGIPVIASRHGGHLETLREGITGTFFTPDNPFDLGEKIIYLISNYKEAQVMADNAQRESLMRFSPDKHASKIISLYKTL